MAENVLAVLTCVFMVGLYIIAYLYTKEIISYEKAIASSMGYYVFMCVLGLVLPSVISKIMN